MRRIPLLLAAWLVFAGLASAGPVTPSATEREAAMRAFVEEMTDKHGFDRGGLRALLAGARFQEDIIRAISRPAEAKPWHEYRGIFVNLARIEGGARFWRDNEGLLRRAEREFGVPPEMIVAIIGVETRYGGNTGKYRVLDALATLAFGYPPRASFFRKELEALLLLAREEGIDLAQVKGSYAGAMGLPQFIPSSYRAYAVDFDGDGRRDLLSSRADVIGSVANYFKEHGWRRGAPVTVPARASGGGLEPLVKAGMKPSLNIETLSAKGVVSDTVLPRGTLASLVRLEGRGGDEYWLGLNNFYVITRYNRSNLYAMAVFQLSREILELRRATQDGPVGR